MSAFITIGVIVFCLAAKWISSIVLSFTLSFPSSSFILISLANLAVDLGERICWSSLSTASFTGCVFIKSCAWSRLPGSVTTLSVFWTNATALFIFFIARSSRPVPITFSCKCEFIVDFFFSSISSDGFVSCVGELVGSVSDILVEGCTGSVVLGLGITGFSSSSGSSDSTFCTSGDTSTESWGLNILNRFWIIFGVSGVILLQWI